MEKLKKEDFIIPQEKIRGLLKTCQKMLDGSWGCLQSACTLCPASDRYAKNGQTCSRNGYDISLSVENAEKFAKEFIELFAPEGMLVWPPKCPECGDAHIEQILKDSYTVTPIEYINENGDVEYGTSEIIEYGESIYQCRQCGHIYAENEDDLIEILKEGCKNE